MNRNRLRATLASAILLLTAGCTTSTSNPPDSAGTPAYRPPEQVRNATVVWSAESDVNLFDSHSTLVRAAAEALEVAVLAGPEKSYPGFDQAVTDPTTRDIYFRSGSRATAYGTLYKHIFDIIPTNGGFTALTCTLFKEFAYESEHGYKIPQSGRRGNALSITFSNIASSHTEIPRATTTSTPASTTPSPRTSGPAEWEAPEDNLFEGWTIEPGSADDYRSERCAPWIATLEPNAPAETETVTTDSPPQALPAYPGWPKLH
ncbi:hypothetical protein HLB23_21120 [Nocardia uniformis]|uniref:Lipoprotein n=1 Tax=Nocardia uniformis TaxID=53432 RepID=A0A849CBM7_9NOCA|nr:hypothetical protein [Nocardia uniformis]NNH72329.1 hypothetical protein [Nocardia uniformis]